MLNALYVGMAVMTWWISPSTVDVKNACASGSSAGLAGLGAVSDELRPGIEASRYGVKSGGRFTRARWVSSVGAWGHGGGGLPVMLYAFR